MQTLRNTSIWRKYRNYVTGRTRFFSTEIIELSSDDIFDVYGEIILKEAKFRLICEFCNRRKKNIITDQFIMTRGIALKDYQVQFYQICPEFNFVIELCEKRM